MKNFFSKVIYFIIDHWLGSLGITTATILIIFENIRCWIINIFANYPHYAWGVTSSLLFSINIFQGIVYSFKIKKISENHKSAGLTWYLGLKKWEKRKYDFFYWFIANKTENTDFAFDIYIGENSPIERKHEIKKAYQKDALIKKNYQYTPDVHAILIDLDLLQYLDHHTNFILRALKSKKYKGIQFHKAIGLSDYKEP